MIRLLMAVIAALLLLPAAAMGARSVLPEIPEPSAGTGMPPPADRAPGAERPSALPALPALSAADLNFGAFAGQVWRDGDPRSVSASWRVPQIHRASGAGNAGTWVGIEAPTQANGAEGAFIQVGTNEVRVHLAGAGPPADFYYAFFSDTDLQFHPREILLVRPGDRVTASMSLSDHRWTVVIRDLTSGAGDRLVTDQEGHGHFNQAEFLQEDVTDDRTDRPFAYPWLSDIHFSHLRINGVVPVRADLLSQWMSENGHYLAPSAVTRDGFTLRPQTLSAPARQFLEIEAPLDSVSDWFVDQARDWVPTTPAVETAAERSAFTQTLQQNAAQLQAATWPTAVQPLITRLVAADAEQSAYVPTVPPATHAGIAHWIDGLSRLFTAHNAVADQIRGLIDLPQYLP